MKKRIVAAMLTLAMVATVFCGCGKTEKKDNNKTDNKVEQSNDATAEADEEDDDDEYKKKDILGVAAKYVGASSKDLQEGRTYDITEVVKLPEYTGVTVDVDLTLGATDEEVDAYIDSVLSSYIEYVKLDKDVVENYDYVNIDYVGKKDGVAFDGGSCDDYNLGIGTGTFIPGFEEGLLGVKVGETVDLDLTFPEVYSNEELAGQSVVFTVKVNYICKKTSRTHDTIDDEFISSRTVYETVDEFRKAAKDYYEQNSSKDENSLREQAAMSYLVDNSTITIPDGMLDDKIDQLITQFRTQIEGYGYDFDYYINLGMGMTYDEFLENVKASAEDNVKEELVLEAIANDMGLTIDETEYTSYIKKSIESNSLEDSADLYTAYDSELSDGALYLSRTFLLTQAKTKYREGLGYNVIRAEE